MSTPPRGWKVPNYTVKDQHGVEAEVFTIEEFRALADREGIQGAWGTGFLGTAEKRAGKPTSFIDLLSKWIPAPYSHIWWYPHTP